ncbi:type VI secretion system baseplate subunit TssE [Noviherbaspirillum sp. UKPF54]|uniref:type VI secretion system baseplate subunit TssE n=1 Tax=Noviherbaspirillum sp. UKPF54 TaxID=2601898 RepID=UPI0011B0FC99|nr:type VI secretion system baseplate subunit TssE [Noviherbaspirillum sp. UKPF54]QDZ27666.1 type VI secretion system baseplate subunit TssE [Noviherbaspirillum sp. UKPF54]
MNHGSSPCAKYSPTLFERLADEAPCEPAERQPLRLITAEELKESVARDLEALLNSRCAFDDEVFGRYPQALRSISSYGMSDFVGLSLANPGDRSHICRSLERTISIHERRLKQVRVSLELENGAVNRLRFAINALLVVHPSAEPVFFDALLQPSTLQYSVNKARRLAPI